MILYLVAVLALGLMCGSELNVAAFAHPTFERQQPEVDLLRSSTRLSTGFRLLLLTI